MIAFKGFNNIINIQKITDKQLDKQTDGHWGKKHRVAFTGTKKSILASV